MFYEVSGQLPPKENPPPWLGLGFGSRSGLVLGLGGQPDNPPMRKIAHRLGLGFGLGLVLGLGGGGGQFSSGAIVIEPC